MIDFTGSIVVMSVIVLLIGVLVGSLRIDTAKRAAILAALGAWVGLTMAFGYAGMYAETGTAIPLAGVMFAIPLVAIAAASALSPAVRATLLALPMPLLIGLNVARVFGAFFLALAAVDRLGGPFPYSAGWGDVLTGVLAIPVALLAGRLASAREWASQGWMIGAWNAFGALDLVVAVGLGLTSATGSPLQVFDAGAGTLAVASMPWALIPTVLVPFYLVIHAVVFAQLRERASEALEHGGRTAGEPA